MKILACGSRGWGDLRFINDVLSKFPVDSVLLHGNAVGADKLAGIAGHFLGMTIEVYPAEWKKYGRRAGFVRNNQMLDMNPDVVLAFWDGSSRGTKHTITEAQRRGIDVEVFVDTKAAVA